MNTDKLGHWISIIANLSVLIGIYFLVLEIRAGEDSNAIEVQQAYFAHNIQLQTLIASDEYALILEKGELGEELSSLDNRKLNNLINIHLAQANFMRRLYLRDIATEEELTSAYQIVRGFARNPAVAELIRLRSESIQQFALEENGIERFIEEIDENR